MHFAHGRFMPLRIMFSPPPSSPGRPKGNNGFVLLVLFFFLLKMSVLVEGCSRLNGDARFSKA